MAKESLHSIDNRIVFKETFQSEQNTRRLGGVPTDVDYSNGIGSFNGSSSSIKYSILLNDTYSVRIKIPNFLISSTVLYLLSTPTAKVIRVTANTDDLVKSSGTSYVNGLPSSKLIENEANDITVSGMSFSDVAIFIGSWNTGFLSWNDGIELVEIYKGTLTSEEASNLYNNKTYHELPDKIDENTYKILDVSAFGGVIEDKMDNELTLTDVETKKIGSNVYSPDFNGSTSKIDCGNFDDLTGDLTILTWVNPRTFGKANVGRILDNGKLLIYNRGSSESIRCISDGATDVSAALNSVKLNKSQFWTIIRKSSGLTTFYLNGVLSGSESQSSGTPEAGTTNINIGNNSTGSGAQDGKIPRTVIYKGILSLEQITQFYTNTKRYFK